MVTTAKKSASVRGARSATPKKAPTKYKTSHGSPHEAALESKTLLENLQLVDELMSRSGLQENRAALLGFRRSMLERLSALHGFTTTLLLKTLSGSAWVAKFPDSKLTSALTTAFAASVNGFISSMTNGGASVTIGTTLRPKERAYLMHYAYRVAKGTIAPKDVPAMVGVDIEWDHGDATASQAAAQDMVSGYSIVYQPALSSRHTDGKAIDMTISWQNILTLKDKAGNSVAISSTPRSGENADLAKVGATFGVIKATFTGDPPHWSTDGH